MLYGLHFGKNNLDGMVAHICDPNIWEIRAGGLRTRSAQ